MGKPYKLNASKFLSTEELKELRRVLALLKPTEPRNVLIIELALATGARSAELLQLTRHSLNVEHSFVFIKGVKGSDDREIPIHQNLFTDLLNQAVSAEHFLFPITYSRLQRIWHLYRPVPKGFHCLRHTFAINLYERTRDIRLLKTALGHRNIANTMIYADYQYSTEELRRLIYG